MKLNSIVPLALGLAVLAFTVFAGGCSLDEILTVDVSKKTRDHYKELGLDVPPQITLREARQLREESDELLLGKLEAVASKHRSANDELDREIADKATIEEIAGMAVNNGIDLGVPALAGIPGGGIAAALLIGLGGWFAPRPGDAKRIAAKTKEAEDKGYDMGRNDAAELLRAKP